MTVYLERGYNRIALMTFFTIFHLLQTISLT